MKQVHVELGALVREYRQKANMTQLDLAQKLGYDSTQFVSLFERGLSKVPFNVLGQLVIILGIPEKKVMKTLLDAYETEVKEKMETGKKAATNVG
ncbi:MAG: hypothetical protein BroJett040_04600 [Oligoflexia bacterium]|nr:MAG: hypothetical protein BroJett040_04600 [Oligoflexia bacterium]